VAAFTRNWEEGQNTNTGNTLDTNYYRETYSKLREFNNIIEQQLPPSYEKIGTIMLET
jgi:hypothetical protein